MREVNTKNLLSRDVFYAAALLTHQLLDVRTIPEGNHVLNVIMKDDPRVFWVIPVHRVCRIKAFAFLSSVLPYATKGILPIHCRVYCDLLE